MWSFSFSNFGKLWPVLERIADNVSTNTSYFQLSDTRIVANGFDIKCWKGEIGRWSIWTASIEILWSSSLLLSHYAWCVFCLFVWLLSSRHHTNNLRKKKKVKLNSFYFIYWLALNGSCPVAWYLSFYLVQTLKELFAKLFRDLWMDISCNEVCTLRSWLFGGYNCKVPTYTVTCRW